MEELQQMQPDDTSRQKMLDILKRFHSEEEEEMDDMDEDDSTLSEETIQRILSGENLSIEDLSVTEKKLFQRAVASGELSKLIEPWEPWWLKPSAKTINLSPNGTQLIQQLTDYKTSTSPEDDNNDLKINQPCETPSGPTTPLTPVRNLISTEPSPLLAFHLADILYSYCFTLRLYNGDWQSDALGSSMVVLSVSSVLGHNRQPETVLEALSHCLEQACSPAYKHMGGLQFALGLIDDIETLISLGGPALICSLCDLQRMMQVGERELKLDKKRRLKEVKSKLRLSERKIYFLMCWVHEQSGDVWPSLAALVRAEKVAAMEYGSGKRTQKMDAGLEETRGKVLIEEIQ